VIRGALLIVIGVAGGALACQPATEPGCEGAELLVRAEDPAAAGPWAVGLRTFERFGMPTDVWYPAEPGSEQGVTAHRYDLRSTMPPAEGAKIPDAEEPFQDCGCFVGLPLDAARGPYPVMIFIHGTASFRHQSAQITSHWASRGFVVIAMDHSGIRLRDMMELNLNARQTDDVRELLGDLRSFSGGFAFLKDRVDLGRLAISGHSAGGFALEDLHDEAGVQVLIPMAGRGTSVQTAGVETLILGAVADTVVEYQKQLDGYASSSSPKALVGLKNAGHLAFSDVCAIGVERGGMVAIALRNGVEFPGTGEELLTRLSTDGCGAGMMAPGRGWAISNHASTAVLERVLTCKDNDSATLAGLAAAFADEVEVSVAR
jgi:dienelactone hydrolase